MIDWGLLEFLFAGSALGLAAGLSPGPLFALVIAQTLRYNLREGIKVAFAPLLSDLPIVTLCLFVLSELPGFSRTLAWISILGGLYVAYLGYEAMRTRSLTLEYGETAPRSLPKAVLLNLLNPSVYVFWATVGSAMILRGWKTSAAWAVAFVVSFYACLVGSKLALALMTSRSRGFLKGRAYLITVRAMGVLLLGIAFWLFRDGLRGLSGAR